MKNSSFVCAAPLCRIVIQATDPAVKIGKYTYCQECAEKKK